jgi:protein gp37
VSTGIEWTDEVWNPVTGCTKVSQGCKNCYAERVAERFWKGRSFGDVQMHPERLEAPLHWRTPRRVFVNSMSDLFHEDVDIGFVLAVWSVMANERCRQHTFQILTKRPSRMLEILRDIENGSGCSVALPNVWLGVSVEDQATADERIPLLLDTPAAVRFVSYEPAIGPIDFTRIDMGSDMCSVLGGRGNLDWIIAGERPRCMPRASAVVP